MRFRKPHGIPHVEADTMFRYSFKILPDRLKLIRLYPCGPLGQSISACRLRSSSWPFCSDFQSDVVGIWSRDLGVMATLSVRQKMQFFSCIYNPQITVSPTSSFSASFNADRVKKSPGTLDLSFQHSTALNLGIGRTYRTGGLNIANC